MSNRDKLWAVIIAILFIISVAAYPGYKGFIGGWPISWVFSTIVGIIYLIVFGIFMWEKTVGRKEE